MPLELERAIYFFSSVRVYYCRNLRGIYVLIHEMLKYFLYIDLKYGENVCAGKNFPNPLSHHPLSCI